MRTRSSGWLGRALLAWSRLAFRRPWAVFVGAMALSALAFFGAARLRVDANLAALLPSGYPSVVALSQFEKKGETSGYVSVLIRGGDALDNRRFARELASKLEPLRLIRYVELERPTRWFEQRSLYFLSDERLRAFADQIEARVDWELYHGGPLDLGLEDEAPPSVEVPKLEAALGDEALKAFRQDDTGALVLLAKPVAPASQLSSARQVVEAVNGAITQLSARGEHPGVEASVGGRYAKNLAQQAAAGRDLRRSSALALLLVLGYLALYFRAFRPLVLVLLPLAVGMLWTFGLAGASFGRLNILTAFMGAILTGIGIDHGIHLASALQGRTGSPRAALQTALARSGRSVSLAAVTTAVGFWGIGFSELKAFREFGLLAGAGVALILVAYLVLVPPLWRLLAGRRPPLAEPRPSLEGQAAGAPEPPKLARAQSPERAPGRSRRWRLGLGLVLLLAPWLAVPSVSFNADLRSLQSDDTPAARVDATIKRVSGASHTPLAVLPESLDQEAAVVARVRQAAQQPGSTLARVLSMADLVPGAQAQKQLQLQRIADALARLPAARISDPELRQQHQRLTELAAAQPFGRGDLPVEVRRRFYPPQQGDPQRDPGYVLAFPAVSVSNGEQAQALARELRAAAGSAPVAGESLIFADVLSLVQQELTWVCALTVALVFAALALSMRSWLRPWLPALTALLPIVSGLGLHALLGGQLNVLNLVLVPILFGVGVDAGVHLLSTQGHSSAERSRTLAAIGASLLTTALGFAALLSATHDGLQSLAHLALAGLLMNGCAALLLVPALLDGARLSVSQPALATALGPPPARVRGAASGERASLAVGAAPGSGAAGLAGAAAEPPPSREPTGAGARSNPSGAAGPRTAARASGAGPPAASGPR